MKISLPEKQTAPRRSYPSVLTEEVRDPKKILNQTFGLWRGRHLNPIAYQRKMRSSYAARHRKSR